jgi:hypothetical protein
MSREPWPAARREAGPEPGADGATVTATLASILAGDANAPAIESPTVAVPLATLLGGPLASILPNRPPGASGPAESKPSEPAKPVEAIVSESLSAMVSGEIRASKPAEPKAVKADGAEKAAKADGGERAAKADKPPEAKRAKSGGDKAAKGGGGTDRRTSKSVPVSRAETSSRTRRNGIVMVMVCSVVGVAMGFLARGAFTPAPEVATPATPAPAKRGPAPPAAPPSESASAAAAAPDAGVAPAAVHTNTLPRASEPPSDDPETAPQPATKKP